MIAAASSYRASSLMRLAHISKNSMVWLPGRGYGVTSPPPESTDEVSEDASEPSEGLAGMATGTGAEAPSPLASDTSASFLRVVR